VSVILILADKKITNFLRMKTTVVTPYYDWDGRKYMEFLIENKVTRIKVPFRYSRVMCRVEGLKTVQELVKGDQVEIILEKKTWDGLEHWVLSYIKTDA
jgi:hypothetical protein